MSDWPLRYPKPLGLYVLDKDGKPVPAKDVLEWGFFLDSGNREVALTRFTRGAVSTVFIGVDPYAMFPRPGYEPMLWETQVFGGPLDGEIERYSSREDAEKGHARWVEACYKAISHGQ